MKTVSKNPNLSDNNLKGSRKNYHPDEMKELKIGDFHSSTLQNCNCANAHRETGSMVLHQTYYHIIHECE